MDFIADKFNHILWFVLTRKLRILLTATDNVPGWCCLLTLKLMVSALRTLRQSVGLWRRGPSEQGELRLSVTELWGSTGTRGCHSVTVSQCHSLTVWLHITYHIYHGHSPAYQVSQVHPMQWDVGRKLSEIINHFYTEEAGDNVLTAVTDKKFTRAGQETFTLHFTLRAQCNIILMI